MPGSFFKHIKIIIIVFDLFVSAASCMSQSANIHDLTIAPEEGYRCRAEIVDGDTIPVFDLNTISVETNYIYKTPKEYILWTRVKKDVKICYPYAILAAAKLKEYDMVLEKMPNEEMRKTYLKMCEKDLRKEFEGVLKELTVPQGEILMKLIDRESGKTTYEIVKEMRGAFQAAMWQALARLFGNTMKHEYDGAQRDVMIERAVKLVESGQF
ncbi:MAG: hypothetical protein K0S32_1452 [Bacteroidetes bacterium]|jgi:hypothetical protein|nr:hypothetical protein [Bacteroidota bacterium]